MAGGMRTLFVGAGEMIELAGTHFAARSPKGIAIANRTLERGEKLAGRLGAEVMRLADLPSRLNTIFSGISTLIAQHNPDQAAVEKVFVNVNPQSTLLLGQARGAAICGLVAGGVAELLRKKQP